MTEHEVWVSYKNAKYRTGQINILAQLNQCGTADIIVILLKHGVSGRAFSKAHHAAYLEAQKRMPLIRKEEEKVIEITTEAEDTEVKQEIETVNQEQSETEKECTGDCKKIIESLENDVKELRDANEQLKSEIDTLIEDNAMVKAENAEYVMRLEKAYRKRTKLKKTNKKLLNLIMKLMEDNK